MTKTAREWLEIILEKLPPRKEHVAILSKKELTTKGELKECRTLDDWIKFGYNQALAEVKTILRETLTTKGEQ